MSATGSKAVLCKDAAVAADLSSNQYHAVKLNGSEQIALCATAGEKCIGILQDAPDTAGDYGKVMVSGLSRAIAGGTVTTMDPLATDASGHLVKATADDFAIGFAMEDATSTQEFQMMVNPVGAVVAPNLEGSVQYAEVAVSNAELLALNTTPKELVAAPGAGYVLEFLSAVLILDHGGTDFATAGDLSIQSGTTSTAVSDTVAAADFLQASADAIRVVQALSADAQLDANESLVLECATADPTAGDGVVRVKVAYRVHATGL